MIRLVPGAMAVALLLFSASAATATEPDGPRLAVYKASAKPPRGLLTLGPNGGRPRRLWGVHRRPLVLPDFYSPISWLPDGERIAFSGVVGFRDGDDGEPIRRIFTVRADGTGLRAIPGTNGAIAPVFSPDGRTVAFTRAIERETRTTIGGKVRPEGFDGASVWTVDLPTGAQRQLTPWREGLEYFASSFSPDGTTLLASHTDDLLINEPEPVALKIDGSGSRRLLEDGFAPVYSPDGSRVALVRRTVEYGEEREEDTDLYVMKADGTDVRRITRTPGRYELSPAWDPSGERLAYVRYSAAGTEAAVFGVGDALMQVNADGTCQTKVASSPRAAFFMPVWQPGPGREVGRIEC